MPGSRLEIIEGVGHFPQIEAPEQFVDALLHFIGSTEPARLGTEDRKRMLQERSELIKP